MAFNRCFDNFNNTIKSSSDYSTAQRQKTIYSELAQNLRNGNANPVKANGVTYNDNFGILNSSGSGCLEYAKDYQLLLDVTKGAYLIHNDNIATQAVPYQALTGNLLVVDYASNGVNVVVDTSYNAGNANEIIFPQTISAHAADLSFNNSYPGVIVDPSYNIFYDECMQGFNSNKNPWLRLSSVGFQTSNLYQQAIKGNPYNNFIYPQKLQIYCNLFDIQYGAAYGINDNGQIVGNIFSSNNLESKPVYWESSTSTPILLKLGGYSFGLATGINNDGVIVGIIINGSISKPAYWSSKDASPTLLDITGVSYPAGALDINNNGEIIGVSTIGVNDNPVYWANIGSSPTIISVNPYTKGVASGINDNATPKIVGSVQNGSTIPAYWVGPSDTPNTISLGTYSEGQAFDINNSELIIGFIFDNDISKPVYWNNTGDNPNLMNLGSYLAGQAIHLNNDGNIVGNVQINTSNTDLTKPVYWESKTASPILLSLAV